MHTISIACDSCGHQEHFTGIYTDASDCLRSLINYANWQRVTFTVDDDDHDEDTTTEHYCPRCHAMPRSHRNEHEIERDELLQELDTACACEDLTVAYNLVDRLFEHYGRTPRGEESTHAAAD